MYVRIPYKRTQLIPLFPYEIANSAIAKKAEATTQCRATLEGVCLFLWLVFLGSEWTKREIMCV